MPSKTAVLQARDELADLHEQVENVYAKYLASDYRSDHIWAEFGYMDSRYADVKSDLDKSKLTSETRANIDDIKRALRQVKKELAPFFKTPKGSYKYEADITGDMDGDYTMTFHTKKEADAFAEEYAKKTGKELKIRKRMFCPA